MRMRWIIATFLIAGLSAAPAFAEVSGAATTPRTLAVIPFYAPERIWQFYTPFIEYLRRETGEPWELKLYPNHDTMIEGVCAGEVDVALLGPVPLARVNSKCGVVPFLVPNGKDGKPTYRSMVITSETGITTLAGLRGKKIGFFKGSTAAHIVPTKMLRDAGLEPGSFEPVFLESQDRIMTGLLTHEVSGAGVKETLYRRFEKEPVHLLQASEDLPNFSFSALPAQPPERRERFVAALLKLKPLEKPADAATVKGWDDEIKNGFAPPTPDFLPAVLKTLAIYEAVMHETP